MKITKQQLRQIIKEEVAKAFSGQPAGTYRRYEDFVQDVHGVLLHEEPVHRADAPDILEAAGIKLEGQLTRWWIQLLGKIQRKLEPRFEFEGNNIKAVNIKLPR